MEAMKVARKLRYSGNRDVTVVIVPGADHSMRIAPPDLDEETRYREMFDYNDAHPFSEFFIHSVTGWTLDRF